MKVLTCAGYYKSGSSAVADLMSEFENVYSFGNYEFGLLKSRDGISDLEYNLIDNPHRVNSGYAIKKYRENVKSWRGNAFYPKCEKLFKGQFVSISEEYVRELTNFTYSGYYPIDIKDRGKVYYFIDRALYHIVKKAGSMRGTSHDKMGRPRKMVKFHLTSKNSVFLPKNMTREEFLLCTRRYLAKLFDVASDKEYVMADQMIPINNYERYKRYFDDIKCVVVDRDPRDVFIYVKHILNERNVPYQRIEQFCEWYRFSHELVEKNPEVLYIHFEDLVLNYEEYAKRVIDFYGVEKSEHKYQYNFFQPEISKQGIGMWKKYPEEATNIGYIEEHLKEYLYVNSQ